MHVLCTILSKKVSLCDVNQLLIQAGIHCYLIFTLRLHAHTNISTRITTPRNLISNNNIILFCVFTYTLFFGTLCIGHLNDAT